jgi:hypothetical protein
MPAANATMNDATANADTLLLRAEQDGLTCSATGPNGLRKSAGCPLWS